MGVKNRADQRNAPTPSLRNVLITASYLHDGFPTALWDVMGHHNKGDGVHDPWLNEDMQRLALSESEIDDVVAFLAKLTSAQDQEQGVKEFGPHALSRMN